VPEGVLAVAAVPGIGPKTAKQLWEALGVATVDDLEAAARAGRVRGVPGFGPAKEKNLLEAIERSRRLSERLPAYVALPYAQRLARELASRPRGGADRDRGQPARGRDTVGDIDLVGTSDDPAATMEAFTRLPGVTETLVQGPADTAVFCDLGLRVDLRLTTPDNFGRLLHHFSSGQAHNIRLARHRAYAGSRSTSTASSTPRRARSVPGRRRGAGLRGARPARSSVPSCARTRRDRGRPARDAAALITEADFAGQLHCHSTYSDGTATVREMAEARSPAGTSIWRSPTIRARCRSRTA
jgi:DNA polymerase (family 10)